MVTIEKLRNFGCNVDEGLSRCLNNESFYLRLVGSLFNDNKVQILIDAINENDLQKAFEAAHALKGVYGNLAITPLFKVTSEITEYLREKKEMDYRPLVEKIQELYRQFVALNN